MLKLAIALQGTALLASVAPTPQVAPAARADLAPTGTLRAGINVGNALLAGKNPATGNPQGIAVEFVEDVKASGFVGRAVEKNGIRGVAVAPKGR